MSNQMVRQTMIIEVEELLADIKAAEFTVTYDPCDTWFSIQDTDPTWYDDMGSVCLTVKSIDRLMEILPHIKNVLTAHRGDPCEFCGIGHDDVGVGPCKGRLARGGTN